MTIAVIHRHANTRLRHRSLVIVFPYVELTRTADDEDTPVGRMHNNEITPGLRKLNLYYVFFIGLNG